MYKWQQNKLYDNSYLKTVNKIYLKFILNYNGIEIYCNFCINYDNVYTLSLNERFVN